LEKLVRDRIPEVMRAAEKRPNFRIALTHERLPLLFAKLQEEIQEFQADQSAEELADVIEVLRAIQMELDISDKRLEACRSRKVAVHGAFREGIVLSLVNAT
jgi:predicted house-cleaning noncanonical NTP pyrophosphatase (MazG superfamily)